MEEVIATTRIGKGQEVVPVRCIRIVGEIAREETEEGKSQRCNQPKDHKEWKMLTTKIQTAHQIISRVPESKAKSLYEASSLENQHLNLDVLSTYNRMTRKSLQRPQMALTKVDKIELGQSTGHRIAVRLQIRKNQYRNMR